MMDRGALHAELDARVSGGKIAVRPKLLAADGITGGIAEDDIGREALIFGPEGVTDPGAQDGAAGEDLACEQHVERFEVVVVRSVHAADEGEIVHDFGRVWEHLGDVHAALAILPEFERAGKKSIDVIRLMNFDAAGKGLPGPLLEEGFGVEEVHLARSPILDELNDGFRLGRKMLTVQKAGKGD